MTTMTEFRWFGGRLALDFVATLGKRDTAVVERIPTAGDLARWFHEAGLGDVRVSTEDLADAVELREALYGLFTNTSADLVTVNHWTERPVPGGRIERVEGQLRRVQSRLTAADLLSLLARDAVDLLTGPGAERVRMCAGDDCTLLFVDESRAGNRRWCSMEACGARSKMARYRAPRA
ncbi:ABATE domain-containing protein [Kibdelosporangium lantanae]